jgi:hypothetical protein
VNNVKIFRKPSVDLTNVASKINLLLLLIFVSSTFLALMPALVSANQGIQFYKIDIKLDDEGKSDVKLVITFKEAEETFSFDIIGRIENFEATSNAGPVDCNVRVSGTSSINCIMDLTETQKELQINFTTSDFVKTLDDKFYFSGDLSPNAYATEISTTIKLPQAALLVGEDISSSILSYPKSASAHILGDSIIVVWTLYKIPATEGLKFEVLYEQVKTPPWFQLRMRHFVLLGASFAVVLGFIFVRYLRRSESVVLSVLDEYERKVMDIISKEGEVKQKQVVQLTNLSKAKVSRVVKNLANRGLIEVERRGRTNRLKLVKKKLKI